MIASARPTSSTTPLASPLWTVTVRTSPIFEDDLPLGFAQPLHHHLLGGLSSYAAGVFGDGPCDDVLPDGSALVDLDRVAQVHHRQRLFHLGAVCDDGADGVDLHLAGVRVEQHRDILPFGHRVALVRGDESLLDGAQYHAMRESPLGSELCYCKEQVTLHSFTFRSDSKLP